MKLSFKELKNLESKSIDFNEQDSWIMSTLINSSPDKIKTNMEPAKWASQTKCSGNLNILNISQSDNFEIEGSLKLTYPAICSISNELFTSERKIEIKGIIHNASSKKASEDQGDLNYWILSGNFLDLAEFIREQIILSEPLVERSKKFKNHEDKDKSKENHNLPFSNLKNLLKDTARG